MNYKKIIIFMSIFTSYLLLAWIGLLYVVSTAPKESIDYIDGTIWTPLIFGSYWISITLSDIKISSDITRNILNNNKLEGKD